MHCDVVIYLVDYSDRKAEFGNSKNYRESYDGIKISIYAAGHCVQLDYGPLHSLGPSTPPPLKAADDGNHKQNEHDNEKCSKVYIPRYCHRRIKLKWVVNIGLFLSSFGQLCAFG